MWILKQKRILLKLCVGFSTIAAIFSFSNLNRFCFGQNFVMAMESDKNIVDVYRLDQEYLEDFFKQRLNQPNKVLVGNLPGWEFVSYKDLKEVFEYLNRKFMQYADESSSGLSNPVAVITPKQQIALYEVLLSYVRCVLFLEEEFSEDSKFSGSAEYDTYGISRCRKEYNEMLGILQKEYSNLDKDDMCRIEFIFSRINDLLLTLNISEGCLDDIVASIGKYFDVCDTGECVDEKYLEKKEGEKEGFHNCVRKIKNYLIGWSRTFKRILVNISIKFKFRKPCYLKIYLNGAENARELAKNISEGTKNQ